MRTTLTIPAEKLDALVGLTGANGVREAILIAIDAFLRRARMNEFKSLKGNLKIDDAWKTARGSVRARR